MTNGEKYGITPEPSDKQDLYQEYLASRRNYPEKTLREALNQQLKDRKQFTTSKVSR